MERRSENRLPDPEYRNQWIAKAAYYQAETRGFVSGGEMDDWLYAEKVFEQSMLRRHTLHKFDIQLRHLHGVLAQMAGLVLDQLRRLMQAIDQGDAELAKLVIADAQNIDDYVIQLDKQVEQILCLESPVANDLRTVLSTAKIGYELESVVNELTEVAELGSGLYSAELHIANPEMLKSVMKLCKQFEQILDHLMDVLKNRGGVDVETLQQYLTECQTAPRAGIVLMAQDVMKIPGMVDILRVIKNLEASAERCLSIAKYLNEMNEVLS